MSNEMKFIFLQKKLNENKIQVFVKLIDVNCNFDLPERKHVNFVKNKMAEFDFQTLVRVINLK